MSSDDRDVALVKAALEAAKACCEVMALNGVVKNGKQCSASALDCVERIEARCDPAAIAATVREERLCLVCGHPGPCEDAPDACTFDPTPQELYDDNVRLRKELAALRRDAERYRWLREIGPYVFWLEHGRNIHGKETLDAAIDAAIAAAPTPAAGPETAPSSPR